MSQSVRVMAQASWQDAAAEHRERVLRITGPHRARAARGEKRWPRAPRRFAIGSSYCATCCSAHRTRH